MNGPQRGVGIAELRGAPSSTRRWHADTVTSIWTTQQASIRVHWGTRPLRMHDTVAALRETLTVLARCGSPFAGPWKIADPSSDDATASLIDDLTDDEVRVLIERRVDRNYDGTPFPRGGYGATLVGTLVGSLGASMRLRVGATVTEFIVNEAAVSLRAMQPTAAVDLRESYGEYHGEVLGHLVEIWRADLAQVTIRDANRSQRGFATLVGLTNYFRGDHSSLLSSIDLPTSAKTAVTDGGTWLTVDVGTDDLVTAVAGIVATADAIEDAGGLVVDALRSSAAR